MVFSRKATVVGAVVMSMAIGFFWGQSGRADSGSVPGSADDPVVTKSYVDAQLALIAKTPAPTASQVGYKVVELKQGQAVLAASDQGLEMIMRNGSNVAKSGTQGSVFDITSGADLNNGSALQLNHLIILARNDGRAVQITGTGTTYALIRGAYTIQ